MSNRHERALIAKDTIKILENGSYLNSKGKLVNIKNFLDYSIRNTILYRPDDFKIIKERVNEILSKNNFNYKTKIEVTNETTLNAGKRLIIDEKYQNTACLNFASAKNPGGGFLKGSNSQEESLARASGLYPCISQIKDYYESNKKFRSALYTDNIIYSPKVPVFRDDDGTFLDKSFLISIISAPAVNARIIKRYESHNIEKIGSVMMNRIDKILSIALINNVEALVLGAWGCGVFKNKPSDVAKYFHKFLGDKGKFSKTFKKIIFAVYDRSKNKKIFNAFYKNVF
ncbi:MAG: TIGR02452 family protein [Promethearchaeota archaeon]